MSTTLLPYALLFIVLAWIFYRTSPLYESGDERRQLIAAVAATLVALGWTAVAAGIVYLFW